MRRAVTIILVCAVTAATTGCSARLGREDPGATPTSTGRSSSTASTADPSTSQAPDPGAPDPGAPTSTPAPAPLADPTSGDPSSPALPPARTDVPDEAVLPVEQGVGDVGEVVAWTLPQACAAGTPGAAAAMRTVTDGDGRFEEVVRVQQVAAFPDTEAAVAEARRLDAEMQRCADDGAADPDGLRVAGSVPVGAQGYGLARRYDAGGAPAPFGTYAAITRRGNAVTLVAHTSGETSVEGSKRVVLADAQAAWERLCLYDRTAGCPD